MRIKKGLRNPKKDMPEIENLAIIVKLNTGKHHQVFLPSEFTESIIQLIIAITGSIQVLETPLEGVEIIRTDLDDETIN